MNATLAFRTGVLAALALLATAPASAQGTPRGDVLVVGNKQEHDASIIEIESGRTIKRLPTGNGPHEVAISPDGRTAVVANYGAQQPGSTLTVIDLPRLAVSATIDLGSYTRPHGIAFFADGRRLAVTSESTRNVVIVDVASGRVVSAIPTEANGSHMLVISSDGSRIYTANIPDASVSVLDVAGGKLIAKYGVGPAAEAIALTADGRELWVGSNQGGHVRVLDAATGEERARLETPGVPIRVYFDPTGTRALVSSAQGGEVRVFEVATRKLLGTIAVEGQPIGLTFSTDGRRAYITRNALSRIAEADLSKFTVLRDLETGIGPDAIGLSTAFRQ